MAVVSFLGNGIQSPGLILEQCYCYPRSRRWRSNSGGGVYNVRVRCGIAEASGAPAPLGQKTKYKDGFFEKAFMTLFARKMEKFAADAGDSNKKGIFDYDYESFVEVSKRVMQGRSRIQQQEVVREVLLSMLPPGAPAQVDLVGGYYDAGDNVKFGFPMAFTTTLLAWSIIEFGSSMQNQVENAKAALRWSSDYLLKAATATPGFLYVQVGNPYGDHQCWERPEDMDTPRNVYKVSSQNPGSDVAAETAAALAASSIVFKDSDPSYSSKLLLTAMRVFEFADTYRGSYSDSLSLVVCPFYCSYSGYHDELLWGASWIHQASKNASYLGYIQSNGHTLGPDDDDYSFSWDDKRPGTKVLLSKGFLEKKTEELELYKRHADNYICSMIPESPNFQAQYTPGGLLYKGSESNLQYVTTSALLLLTYAKYLSTNGLVAYCGTSTITSDKLISLAKKQVDYILGDNPVKMSYMVGFGDKYPMHIHHRGSSLPSVHAYPDHIACNDGFRYLHSGSPNPNILVGAIVGGPDNKDNFSDDRENYQQSEPATYINAPFVGAVAFFSAKSQVTQHL